MSKQINSRKQGGFSLLEVVIGIFIFVVGLAAMAALQGALTRSMADSKLHTTAVNIGDRLIESQRGFRTLIDATAAHAYNDIVTATGGSVPLNGVTYTTDMVVTDYYYHLDSDSFTTASTGATSSDYKQVEVTVSWNTDLDFRKDEGTVVDADDVGTGSVTLTSVIPAIISSATARVADETSNAGSAPPVSYEPGLRPDIVSLALLDNKFKESLKPLPQVIRTDELVETRFDVITYSAANGVGNETFLRREEFSAISCECTLKNNASGVVLARRPVVWAGDEYAGGNLVGKPYGISANNQQSSVCDSCCADHHDGGTSAEDHQTDPYYNVYGPFKGDAEYSGTVRASNHKHYKDDGTIATNNQKYREACRMVRVDGFFRVAQDFRREDQYIFPEDFLDEQGEINTYSDYATTAVEAYSNDVADGYPSRAILPCIGGPSPCVADPVMQGDSPLAIGADQLPSWTELPFGQSPPSETQQLRSRGIYIDYLSNDLKSVLACIAGGGDAESCQSGDVILDKTGSINVLEMLPFFDVQLTFLNRWNETPVNTPVDTSNEGLEDNNTHSRGVISKDDDGSSTVEAKGHRGNLGFTDTPAIDPVYNNYVTSAELNIQAGTGGPVDPPPTGDPIIAGMLNITVSGNPTINVGPGNNGATCGQTGADWFCEVDPLDVTATVTISGYGGVNKTRYACADGLTITGTPVTDGTGATTTFIVGGVAEGDTYTITIQDSGC